jgi:hypothetical protein
LRSLDFEGLLPFCCPRIRSPVVGVSPLERSVLVRQGANLARLAVDRCVLPFVENVHEELASGMNFGAGEHEIDEAYAHLGSNARVPVVRGGERRSSEQPR